MNYLHKIKTGLVLSAALTGTIAFAQSHTGNGGGAFFCVNAGGELSNGILEDFIEGQISKYHLDIKKETGTISDIQYFDPTLYRLVQKIAPEVKAQFDAALDSKVPDVDLKLAKSSNPDIRGISCASGMTSQFYTVVRYESTGLMVNKTAYRALNEKNQRALLDHEIIFKAFRDLYFDTDSSRARAVNAGIYSTFNFDNFAENLSNLPFDANSRAEAGNTTHFNYASLKKIWELAEQVTDPIQALGLDRSSKRKAFCEEYVIQRGAEKKLLWINSYQMTVKAKRGKAKMTRGFFEEISQGASVGQCDADHLRQISKDLMICQGDGYESTGPDLAMVKTDHLHVCAITQD